MILQETKTVPIADADWTDDGTVELVTFPHTGEHRTHMAPETARALAQRLVEAATDAENAAAETHAQRADRAVQHEFDIDLPEAPRTERGFPGGHATMCGVGSSGSCSVPWCTCECHRWARAVQP